jgi:hypothetical protein
MMASSWKRTSTQTTVQQLQAVGRQIHQTLQYMCTDKKEKKIFLTYKEIQMEAVSKSYMRKDFLIYEEFSHIWGGR